MNYAWIMLLVTSETSQQEEHLQIHDTGMYLSPLLNEAVCYGRRSSFMGRQAGGMSCNSFPLTISCMTWGKSLNWVSVDLFVIW